jgi:hypothetical protein
MVVSSFHPSKVDERAHALQFPEFLREQTFVDAKIQIDLGLRNRVHRQLLGQ